MTHGLPDSEIVVETPELVAFRYDIAGIGTRFVAQAIDFCLVGAGLLEIVLLGALVATATSGPTGIAVAVILAFLAVFGYFPAFELAWRGETPGKRAVGVRVAGLSGEPAERSQLIIRNLVRLVDFLPAYYGVGVIAMFADSRSRRLGDLAAGTLVVRDRQSISLQMLEARMEDEAPIGSDRLSGLEPNLRQLVASYAARRAELSPERRQAVAQAAAASLAAAEPEAYAAGGALAALELLASEATGSATSGLATLPAARRALVAGALACVCLPLCPVATLGFGIYSLVQASRADAQLAASPDQLVFGKPQAQVGRMLAVAGLIGMLSLVATAALLIAGAVRG